jgi:hypothetical protein
MKVVFTFADGKTATVTSDDAGISRLISRLIDIASRDCERIRKARGNEVWVAKSYDILVRHGFLVKEAWNAPAPISIQIE